MEGRSGARESVPYPERSCRAARCSWRCRARAGLQCLTPLPLGPTRTRGACPGFSGVHSPVARAQDRAATPEARFKTRKVVSLRASLSRRLPRFPSAIPRRPHERSAGQDSSLAQRTAPPAPALAPQQRRSASFGTFRAPAGPQVGLEYFNRAIKGMLTYICSEIHF